MDAEVSSNAPAAWWLSNPGEARTTKGRTMIGKVKKVALGVAALTGAAVGGAAVAGAATSHPGTATTPAATSGHPPPPQNMPAPGTAAHEDAEKAVTGDAAAKARAAAVGAAGGGTAGDVTTDYFGNGYEVTVTKSDGSKVEYHLDRSFQVLPRAGRWGGPPPPPPSGSAN
jgi:hypothetical protein